ncbi:DUF4390 domain-containing protein [Methylomonas sp. MgM2]
MPNLARTVSPVLLVFLFFWPLCSLADVFSAQIQRADLVDNGQNLRVQAKIKYRLSPTAKEALHKGVALTWIVLVEIREIGRIWDSNIYSLELPYCLQFHALLNQYEVVTPNKQSEMFLTLNAALSFLSNLRDTKPIPADIFRSGRRHVLAVKCQFDRESLPVPLRPFTYLDSQWYLSSDWYLCPIRK